MFQQAFVIQHQQGASAQVEASARAGHGFAPELAVGNTIDERFAGKAAEMAEQAVAGIRIAGVNHEDARFVGECEANDEGQARAAVEAAAQLREMAEFEAERKKALERFISEASEDSWRDWHRLLLSRAAPGG